MQRQCWGVGATLTTCSQSNNGPPYCRLLDEPCAPEDLIRADEGVCPDVAIRVRTEPSKPSNVLEFVFSVQVPSIVLEFNSMFSNVLEKKCLENAIILAVYWRKELNKFAHPTTSGKKRRDPNSCRTNARQPSASCDAHFARRSGAEAQTANGCVRHKLSFSRVQLHGNSAPNDMCFRLAFSPVLCAMDLCRVLMHFYVIGYTLCLAGIGTVCSEVSG